MCIAVIKRSKNPDYKFFIGVNREERYSNGWEKISNHWKDTPDIFGYKDNLSGGTWFAYNKNLLAILVNQESNGYEHLETRSNIVLQSLQNADSISHSISNLSDKDMSKYKPFNLLLFSRNQVFCITNFYDNEIKQDLSIQELDDELIMLNRSFPNDMSETRIVSNFDKFKNAKEPVPQENEWQEWEQLLTMECFTNFPSEETCLWLNSQEWGTLVSDIIALPKDKNKSPIIHNVKERKLMDFYNYIANQTNNENIAVIEKDKSWTYKEFAEHTLSVCNYLTENKINKIMVCLPQGFHAYTILWGAYLAGVTFCPVTISAPLDRKKYYTSLFKPDIIIGNQSEIFEENIFVTVENYKETANNFSKLVPSQNNPETLAYVIFTSGSTGRPKGVMIERKGLENFLAWSTKEYAVKAGDRWGQFSNLGFDLSICDIFTAILNGATLVPFASQMDKMMPGKSIKNNQITLWHSVPSVIDMLNKAGHLNKETLSTVHTMSFCGERLFPTQLDLLFEANPNLTIYNTYGPTEGTVFCSYLKLTKENYKQYCQNTVCIGKTIQGYEICLTDDKENQNEIVIISDYIGKGYLSSEDETATPTSDAFRTICKNGKTIRAYYTGDFGEVKDENLYFAGRKDAQIKVMGHRIDLSEIDFHLRECGCSANFTTFYQNKIISFFIHKSYSEEEIRKYLAEKLPAYYLPNIIIRKQEFRYNTNEKIDVKEFLKEINI